MSQAHSSPLQVSDHELVRCIGKGSYGEVWLARNVLGTWRAVKIVRRESFDNERPYKREFEGIRRFEPISRSHPGQVNILHLGRNQAEGYFYYVMELADDAGGKPVAPGTDSPATCNYEARTLKTELERRPRLPVSECVRLGIELAEALAHLHANGLVHRDVKPANILFIGGRAKLGDIGLVTTLDSTRTYVGTEGFLPPEGAGTPGADLYALGKVLYEMSSGKDRRDFPQAPSELDNFADRHEYLELAEIIEKACAPEPANRYAGAETMRADLALLEAGKSVRTHHARQRRFAAARRLAIAVGGVALIFLLGGIATMLWYGKTRRDPKLTLGEARGTTNTAAFNEYQVAQFHLAKRTASDVSNALHHFDAAVALDPTFARAHAGRADCFNLLATYQWAGTGLVEDIWLAARHAANTALRLNTNLAEAHLALALFQRNHQWNWAESDQSFRRALQLASNNAVAHQWYSGLLSIQGRFDESIAEARRAVELEPSSPAINSNLGLRLYLARRYQEAIAQYRKALTLDPGFPAALLELSAVFAQTELLLDAATMRLDGLARSDESPQTVAGLRKTMFENGTIAFWRAYALLLEKAEPPKPVRLAEARLRSGELEAALQALTDAIEQRDPSVIYLNVDPLYDALRFEPRFLQLVTRLGLNQRRSPVAESNPATRLTPAELGAGISLEEKAAGFRPLFDGASLQGWRGSPPDSRNWRAQDGCLCQLQREGNLVYEAEIVPDNFELRFDWKVETNCNSGIFYRPGIVEYQVVDGSQIDPTHQPSRLPGALTDGTGPVSDSSRPVGEWNEGRIICRGTTLEHWLNGRRLFHFDYSRPDHAHVLQRLDALEFRQLKDTFGNVRARGGVLSLRAQSEARACYRHLRWRRLE